MTSRRPYLIRAIYEWIVDNGLTPMLMVGPEDFTPETTAQDTQVTVYNISPQAVRDLMIDEDSVRFSARFQGVSKEVVIDIAHVLRVYCRENNEGLGFLWSEPPSSEVVEKIEKKETPQPKKRSHLRLVTDNDSKTAEPS